MKIESLAISNWRSIKYLEIEFQDLMIFIGQNNHGKSNVLSALLFFFGEIKPQDLDFNSRAQELFVEITFGDLDQTDRTTFKKYLAANGSIRFASLHMLAATSNIAVTFKTRLRNGYVKRTPPLYRREKLLKAYRSAPSFLRPEG